MSKEDELARSTLDLPVNAAERAHRLEALEQAALPSGVRLRDRYRLVRLIGRGATGSVYRALDESRENLPVALKLLHEQRPRALVQLKNEFRALAETVHPNLVGLHGLGVDERGWFVVMDLIDPCRDFRDYVCSGPSGALDETKLRSALLQLLRGVAAIHDAGKLHRDLKPSNVLVDKDGRVVIADFGLVRDQHQDDGTLLTEGCFVGTLLYAAPEQVRGSRVGPKADLYAVGVMLFEALTGKLPIEADSEQELWKKKQQGNEPAPSTWPAHAASDLRALCDSLLRRCPDERPSARQALAQLGDRGLAVRQPGSVFVAREAELGALHQALRATRQGTARVVTLRGAAGVGKSALLAQFAAKLRKEGSTVVLTGRCHAQEQVPYKAFDGLIDELGRYLASLSPVLCAELMPRDVGLLSRLFPTLARVAAVRALVADERCDTDDALLRARAFAALKQLLVRMTERAPLLLCFDDLQWRDLDSSELLRELLSAPDAPSCLFLCVLRDGDAQADPPSALYGLQEKQQLELHLSALAPESTERLARELSDAPLSAADVQLIVDESLGNPFLVHELLRAAHARGALRGVRATVAARVAALSTDARVLLQLVCVAGQPLPLALALSLAECSPEALPAALASTLLRSNVVDGVELLESAHEQVRDAVSAALDPAQQLSFHARLARALAEAPDLDPERVARHYHAAGLTREAAPYTLEAADRAQRAFAFGRAVELYTQALTAASAGQRYALLVRLADAYASAGRLVDAAARYQEAAAQAAEPAEQRALLRKAMLCCLLTGETQRGLSLADLLCKQLSMAPLPRSRLLLRGRHLLLGLRYLLGGRISTLSVPERSRHTGHSKERLELSLLAARGFAFSSPDPCLYFGLHSLILTRRHADLQGWAQALAGEVCLRCAEPSTSNARDERDMARALALAEAQGDEEAVAMVQAIDGSRRLLTGDFAGAVACFERAEQVLSARGRSVAQVFNGTRIGRFAAWNWMGEFTAIERSYHTWVGEARALGDRHGAALLEQVSSYRLLARDAPELARAARRSGRGSEQTLSDAEPWWLADIALYEGEPGRALEAYEHARGSRFFRTAQRGSWHRTWSALTLSRIWLTLARGRPSAAQLRRVEGALSILERQSYRVAPAAAAQVRGSLAVVRGDHARAVRELAQAADVYERCACLPLAYAVRYRQGQLQGGDAGRALMQGALERSLALGLLRPLSWFRMLAPGGAD